VLVLAGVHGDEPEGFLFLERLEKEVIQSNPIDKRIALYSCSRINPDGCEKNRRTNERNVDLNRNLPTRDWTADFSNVRYYPGEAPGSEPETRATLQMIADLKPRVVFSLHSYEHPMINYNGPCLDLAEEMQKHNGLQPKGDIGYPTPGSLGTWGGHERSLPVITLEILRGQPEAQVYEQHFRAMIAGIEFALHYATPSMAQE